MKICIECEFCFPNMKNKNSDKPFLCAGGDDSPDYFKNYGDEISDDESLINHNCKGFHQGLRYYLNKKGVIN